MSMIRIKEVDAQNILDVCKLTANHSGIGAAIEEYPCCNAVAIAEAKYYPEMHLNAIYNNNVLIGFFIVPACRKSSGYGNHFPLYDRLSLSA